MGRGGDGDPEESKAAPAAPKHAVSIEYSTMEASFEKDAIEVAVNAVENHTQNKDIATAIKKEYDKKYPSGNSATEGVYHCIVGTNFATAVSHETRFFAHLKVDLLHVILFKSKDSPFDD